MNLVKMDLVEMYSTLTFIFKCISFIYISSFCVFFRDNSKTSYRTVAPCFIDKYFPFSYIWLLFYSPEDSWNKLENEKNS